MFRRGLIAETEQLLKQGLAQNRNAMQALGYRQVSEYLRRERTLNDTVELVKIRYSSICQAPDDVVPQTASVEVGPMSE